MREMTDVIANHIRSEFPHVTVNVEHFLLIEKSWIIYCYSSRRKHVNIVVFPDYLTLWELDRKTAPRTMLSWEAPDTFEIIDKALGKL